MLKKKIKIKSHTILSSTRMKKNNHAFPKMTVWKASILYINTLMKDREYSLYFSSKAHPSFTAANKQSNKQPQKSHTLLFDHCKVSLIHTKSLQIHPNAGTLHDRYHSRWIHSVINIQRIKFIPFLKHS